eukprot:930162-Rhodomonas_salina.1
MRPPSQTQLRDPLSRCAWLLTWNCCIAGRGFAQELFTAAPSAGVDIVLAAAYTLGSESEIDHAARQLAQSGARVIILLAFDSDIEALTSAADRNGVLGTGYTWITTTEIPVDSVIAASADPQKTRQQLT